MLFPSWDGEKERRIVDFRGTLNPVAMRAGVAAGSVTPQMLRHTYCSARLQTLDRGEPVSVDTVRGSGTSAGTTQGSSQARAVENPA
jgi:integrase